MASRLQQLLNIQVAADASDRHSFCERVVAALKALHPQKYLHVLAEATLVAL